MKFACPESQNRVSLKCGNIASGLAMASLGALTGSSDAGGAGDVACVASEAACDRAQRVGATKPRLIASSKAGGRAVRCRTGQFVVQWVTMKMNFNFNIIRTN